MTFLTERGKVALDHLALQSASDRGDELARKEVRLPAATFDFRCDLDGFVGWRRGLRLFRVKWLGDEVDARQATPALASADLFESELEGCHLRGSVSSF